MAYLEESRDIALDDLGDISLEMLHQRSCELGGGLATGIAFYTSAKSPGMTYRQKAPDLS